MIKCDTQAGKLSVSEAVGQLARAYTALIRAGVSLRRFPSVMLWGPPGVGKSQGVKQLGTALAQRTGKRVEITDVRLLLFNPVDLRGIPTANADKTLAVWLRPKIFQMDEDDGVINILFLDEISAAPQSVQAAAYQITLDRTVGEHKLPENCIVIAAGNRVTDRSVAYNMPRALANRLCHLEIVSDSGSWHEWAVMAGINRVVLGFLSSRPGMLTGGDIDENTLSFPTPRSWEMVSNVLNHVSENIDDVFPLISGCIGEEAAHALRAWSEVYSRVPPMSAIVSGEECGVPVRPESLFAVASQIPPYMRCCRDERELKNVIGYAARLPVEFRDRVFSDLLEIRPLHEQLQKNAVFDDWFMRSGRYWEDYGL